MLYKIYTKSIQLLFVLSSKGIYYYEWERIFLYILHMDHYIYTKLYIINCNQKIRLDSIRVYNIYKHSSLYSCIILQKQNENCS